MNTILLLIGVLLIASGAARLRGTGRRVVRPRAPLLWTVKTILLLIGILMVIGAAGYYANQRILADLRATEDKFRADEDVRLNAKRQANEAKIREEARENQATIERWAATTREACRQEDARRSQFDEEYAAAVERFNSMPVGEEYFNEAEHLIRLKGAEQARREAFEDEYLVPYMPEDRRAETMRRRQFDRDYAAAVIKATGMRSVPIPRQLKLLKDQEAARRQAFDAAHK
jgi:hypothetical protein